MGFLNILDEAEIHAIPRTWEKWISIIREKYGKKQTFQSKGFSTILIKAEIHTIPKIWKKWIPIVREKYGKTQTFQSNRFLKYFGWSRNPYNSQNMGKVNSHNMEKVWEKQTFQSYGFLKYFGWSRNPYNSQNMGKVNLHSTGKVRENTEISHSFRYLADLELMRTHGIPNVCECTNSNKMKIFCGESYHSQAVGFWGN